MSWTSDPEIQAAMAERRARVALWRNTLIWLPFFILVTIGFLFFLVDELTGGDRGSWFLVGLLGFFAILLGVQSMQTTIDLFNQPIETTGLVTRRWSRTDSLVMRSHYIRVNRKIFRIERDLHGDLGEGDYVWVRFYPRSSTVVQVKKLEPPAGEAEA